MYAKASSESDHSEGVQAPDNGSASSQHRTVMEFEDNRLAATIFGQHDHNIARIEQRLGVLLINRGNRVAIEGNPAAMENAKQVLEELYEHAKAGRDIEIGDVDGALRMIAGVAEPAKKKEPKAPKTAAEGGGSNSHLKITTRNKVIMPRSPGQADYIAKLQKNEMVFGVGPAGTGKTYLAVAMAVARMLAGEIDRIVLSRLRLRLVKILVFCRVTSRTKSIHTFVHFMMRFMT